MKRKSQKKLAQKQTNKEEKRTTSTMPAPAMLIKILSIFLSMILVIALTLYVMGRMPARGFWTLAILLAIIAFFVLPMMRKKFSN